MSNNPLILVDVTNGVGTITLNRPSSLNAFVLELAEQFLQTLEAFEGNPDVRCVVIRGTGRVFSAGGDVRTMLETVRGGDRAAYFREALTLFHRVVLAVRKLPKPVVASVHGAVAGYAFNLMLSCDFRIAAENTRFSQAFIRLGLSPDGGGTWALPRIVGHARACELMMLPTELDARKGLEWGLLNRVVPTDQLEAETSTLALQLAQGPSVAIARTKSLLWDAELEAFTRHLESERLAQVANAASNDFEEGLSAFVERRAPAFTGR